MTNLKSILQRASDRRLKAGGVSKELIDDLSSYRKQQLVVFAAIEVALMFGVSFCSYYLAAHPTNSTQAKMLAGFIGIGSGGGIEVMRRIWKEWSQTTLLLIMLREASQAQVTELIDRLLKKL
ncbi:MAG: hypothetical protein LAO20_18550 [Acidobacteriia bacterium]|nr:hypothetical protein [Terriglobia bacterium]